MKKQLFILLKTFIFGGISISAFAQNYYNVRMVYLAQPKLEQVCYEVQLASANQSDMNLAGQNYRIYYNSESFRFNWGDTKSLLPKDKYTALTNKDNLVEINTSGTGTLPFESHLGFLNIGNDLDDVEKGGVILPANGEWISTTQVCFDYINKEEVTLNKGVDYFVWARPELTSAYATAYMEVAEWVEPFKTEPALVDTYHDADLSTSLEEALWQRKINIYPNPTKDKVWVDFDEKEELKLKVWSTNGSLLMENILLKGSNQSSFNLGDYPTGMYQIEVSNGQKKLFKRIAKIE